MSSRTLAARYAELKQEAPGCLLLMQVGAFMQVLNEDARTVSGVTGLKLQLSGDVDAPVVSGGFPRSGLDAYVGRLVRAGQSQHATPYALLGFLRRLRNLKPSGGGNA